MTPMDLLPALRASRDAAEMRRLHEVHPCMGSGKTSINSSHRFRDLYKELDFLDDLDDDAALGRVRWAEIREQWQTAMASADKKLMQNTLDAISLAQNRTQQHIRAYKEVPSQRRVRQGEEWLARAISADASYEYLFNTLFRRMKLIAQAEIAEIEKQKAARVKMMAELPVRLEILKARAKIATVRYELRRSKEEDRRLIHLLIQTGVLRKEDMPALMEQVRAMGQTKRETIAMEARDRWLARLAEAEEKLRANMGQIEVLAETEIQTP